MIVKKLNYICPSFSSFYYLYFLNKSDFLKKSKYSKLKIGCIMWLYYLLLILDINYSYRTHSFIDIWFCS